MPALAACLALTACGSDGTPAPTAQTGTPAPSATATKPKPTKDPKPPKPSVTPPPSVAASALPTDLADGRHYAKLKTLDTGKHTTSVDIVQFLTGEAAEKAAQEDGQEAFDYYVRNQNDKLRTLTFAPNAKVVVNTLTASETGSSSKDTTITLAKLKSYFGNGQAQQRLFWFTLSKGVIVEFHEQYLP